MKNHEHPVVTYLKDYVPPAFLVETLHLTVDIADEATIVTAKSQMRRNSSSETAKAPLVLNGEKMELISVKVGQNKLSPQQYQLSDIDLTIPNLNDEFELEIVTKIKPKENTELSGLYCSRDIYCTQCEAEGFRRITYFLDRPDVMARYTTTIIADKNRYPVLLSNGNLIKEQILENDRHMVTWEDPFKKPSYLFALVAGNLEFIHDKFTTMSGRDVNLKIFTEPGQSDKAMHAMDSLKKVMRWDEETYGREYDLNIYMIVAINDFNMGAMENKGLNIFNDKYILANSNVATDTDFKNILIVVGHEYLHNWSGNRVTCRDWFQLSLKEGLTVFREHEFSGDHTSKTVNRIQNVNLLRKSQFVEDAGPLAHPVQPDSYIEISNFYTTTIYEKGAEVIRVLKILLGQEAFRKGMDLYFKRHDGTAATIEDFIRAHEDASGKDLKQFRLWYHQAGTPEVEVTTEYNPQAKTYTLTLKQSCPSTPGQETKKPLHIPIAVGLLNANGEEISLKLKNDAEGASTKTKVLELKQMSETFQFENVIEKPILSVLRDFTAPVKLNMDYTDDELRFLLAHDTDGFNRWEAGQRFAARVILNLVQAVQQKEKLTLDQQFIDTFELILNAEMEDKIFQGDLLVLPSETYLSEMLKIIDVDAIHNARKFVRQQLAEHLHEIFVDNYHMNQIDGSYKNDKISIGKRYLRNVCLAYLSYKNNAATRKLCMDQFVKANNMTDRIAALGVLNHIACDEREEAFARFDKDWRHDPLVMDKWFSTQAISELPGTLAKVKELMKHPAYNFKNPNKVRALVGVFCHENIVQFHALSGESYEFLADQVLVQDQINPISASRLAIPLTRWRRYDMARQKLMREQLERISKTPKLSKDVYEVVSKSL